MPNLTENEFKEYLRNNASKEWFVPGKIYHHSDVLNKDGVPHTSISSKLGQIIGEGDETGIRGFVDLSVAYFSAWQNDRNSSVQIKLYDGS